MKLPLPFHASAPRLGVWFLPACAILALPLQAQWTVSHLSQSRDNLAGASESGLALFGGGLDQNSPGQVSDRVDIYDSATGKWRTASLSVARWRLSAASAQGKVFFAGGLPQESTTVDTTRVDIYDIASDSWSTTEMPFSGYLQAGIGLADRVYFMGGAVAQVGGLTVVQIYHIPSQTWSVVDLGGNWRTWVGTATDGRRVFFAGGGGNTEDRRLNIYDSLTDTWSEQVLPHRRGRANLLVLNGKLYVSGGCTNARAVDILDIEVGTWSLKFLPEGGRCELATAAVGPYAIYASGIKPPSAVPKPSADVFNTVTGEWLTQPISTHAKIRPGVSLENANTALFAGGSIGSHTGDGTDLVDIFRYEPSIGTPYCGPANLTSTGKSAMLSAFGAEFAGDNFFTLQAQQLPPNQFAYFLVGSSQDFVPFVGGSQGNLCLGGPLLGRFRAQAASSGSDGSLVLSIDLVNLPTTPPHTVARGETWMFQAWFRDQNPGRTSNMTNGLAVTFK